MESTGASQDCERIRSGGPTGAAGREGEAFGGGGGGLGEDVTSPRDGLLNRTGTEFPPSLGIVRCLCKVSLSLPLSSGLSDAP
jgi:hypothetical protein